MITQGRLAGGEEASRVAYRLMREARSLPETKANLPRIIADYRRSLAILPDPIAEVHLAKLLATNGQKDEARVVFQSLQSRVSSGQVSMVTNDPSLALDIADTTRKLGMTSLSEATVAGLADGPIHQIDARFHLPELDHDPAHAHVNGLFAAGIGKLRVHDNEGAVRLFQQVVAMRPNWGEGTFMLAYANAYAGHKADAETGYAKAARMGVRRPKGL